MKYCKLANKSCVIFGTSINADTFSSKNTINGLKDCSERTCVYRGHDGCLLKEDNKD